LSFFFVLLLLSNKNYSFAQSSNQKTDTLKANIILNWNKTESGSYPYQNAVKDFGSIIDWPIGRTDIIDGTFRVTLLPNLLSGYGGLVAKTLIE
jgi:hypothetical protein